MKNKFYAVKNGRNPGIYSSWEECKKQVDGFENAKYKSFVTHQEALDYLNGTSKSPTKTFKTTTKPKPLIQPSFGFEKEVSNSKPIKIEKIDNHKWVIAYTDGSFRKQDNSFSYGAIILLDNYRLELSQRYFEGENAKLRNVAGEIYGAARVMEYAYNNKISQLEIHHDYQGISAWATGKWQANKEMTKKYREFAYKVQKKVKIRFVWVKGHSGEAGNELVDKLASQATTNFLERKVENDGTI